MQGTLTLRDTHGQRKYMIQEERQRFQDIALTKGPETKALCLLLLWTGARIGEIQALTKDSFDVANNVIVIRTLKQRRKKVFRDIPIPEAFMSQMVETFGIKQNDRQERQIWQWSKRTAQRRIEDIMSEANIRGIHACPKGIRHSFAVHCVLSKLPLTTIQKWMGHVYLETTSIYLNVIGQEERKLAMRIWEEMKI